MKILNVVSLLMVLLGTVFMYARDSTQQNGRATKPIKQPGKIQSLADGVKEAWVRHSSGLAPGEDISAAIAVDSLGNVYVTGHSSSLPFGVDYLTVKYNAAGTEIWTARFNGAGNGDDVAMAVSVDAAGNVYVTGWSDGLNTSSDYATIKYNSEGVEQWVAYYKGPGFSYDRATALAIDTMGNVYVLITCVKSDYFVENNLEKCYRDGIIDF